MKTSPAGQIRICRICGTTPTLLNRNYDLCHKCYALYLEAREKADKQFLPSDINRQKAMHTLKKINEKIGKGDSYLREG